MATTMQQDAFSKRPLYVFDIPKEILQSLEPAHTGSSPAEGDDAFDGSNVEGSEIHENNTTPKKLTCRHCNLTFTDVSDQRSHFRSGFHKFNLKLRRRGQKPDTEEQFKERLANTAEHQLNASESSGDQSDSASDSDDDDDAKAQEDAKQAAKLSNLLESLGNLDDVQDSEPVGKARKRANVKTPIVWFGSPALPKDTTIGIYSALFSPAEIAIGQDLVTALRRKQVEPQQPPKPIKQPQNPPDGGVALPVEAPATIHTPHVFLCMIGGGHFAAMVVSLAPKITKNHNAVDTRQATVIAHKTFHRYTTRRKQGGAQSANDNSKGNAHSAGASIRRHNEEALEEEVRALLREWKALIDSSELLFIRATGSANRNTVYGLAKEDPNWPLSPKDERIRGFPFNTRRPTESELMRCFVELTRAKVRIFDEEAERKAAAEEEEVRRRRQEEEQERLARKKEEEAKRAAVNKQNQEASMHTTQLTALIKRNKASAVLSYLKQNDLDPTHRFHPPDAHYHAPTPLHFAASNNSPIVVTALLLKAGADPAILSDDAKTPVELAGDRATRDAFSIARGELGEERWDWDKANVAPAITKNEAARRAEQEKKEAVEAEEARRQEGLQKLKEEEAKKEEEQRERGDARREKKHGKGKTVMSSTKEPTAEERRDREARGMTPEMKMRMEREKRARAVEERMKRMAAQQ